jgi:hypothetical protein
MPLCHARFCSCRCVDAVDGHPRVFLGSAARAPKYHARKSFYIMGLWR